MYGLTEFLALGEDLLHCHGGDDDAGLALDDTSDDVLEVLGAVFFFVAADIAQEHGILFHAFVVSELSPTCPYGIPSKLLIPSNFLDVQDLPSSESCSPSLRLPTHHGGPHPADPPTCSALASTQDRAGRR